MTYEIIGSNGDHIYFDNYHYSVLRAGLKGLSGYPNDLNLISSPGQIGSLCSSVTITPRYISLPVVIYGLGRAILERKWSRIVAALNPINGPSTLIYTRADGTRWYLGIYPDSDYPDIVEGVADDAPAMSVSVDLVAPDPCWYCETEINLPLRGFVGGFSLPFSLPFSLGGVGTTATITNPGDTPTPCEIKLVGLLVRPVVTLVTTGETITVNRTINAGEILTITTEYGNKRVTLTAADGTVTNAMHYVTTRSRYLQIPAGMSQVRYTANEEGPTAMGYLTYTPRRGSI